MAFTSSQLAMIHYVVDELMQRMDALTNPCELGHADVIGMFAPPEHRKVLIDYPHIADVSHYYAGEIKWPWPTSALGGAREIGLTFALEGSTAAPRPAIPKLPRLQEDTPEHVLKHVTSWVSRRIEIGRDFGRVKQVVTELDNLCDKPIQVRYLFPAILQLMQRTTLRDMARELEFRASRTQPTPSWSLTQAIKAASGTITAACLLPVGDLPSRPVSLKLDPVPKVREFLREREYTSEGDMRVEQSFVFQPL